MPFVHTKLCTEIKFLWRLLASLCTPPEADRGGLPGNMQCQRRFQPQRSSWTPLLTLPGKNNPARRQSKEGGSSASAPRSTNQLLPKARAAPGEDAPVQAAGGSWLQPSCQTPAKPFPHQECPQQPPSPYQGQHCPRAAPSLSQVTHRGTCIIPPSLWMSSHALTTGSGLCTQGSCQHC